MRRGFSFEQHINKLVAWVNNNGGHAHKNHPNKTEAGIRVEGEPFDYEIFYKNKLYCFDAKESQTEKWSLKNAKITQIKHLKNCEKNGAEAFFLVYFYPHDTMVRFDVSAVLGALEGGRTHLKASDGQKFKFEV